MDLLDFGVGQSLGGKCGDLETELSRVGVVPFGIKIELNPDIFNQTRHFETVFI